MQGTLTFVRIYSGTLETGTFVSNPNKGKKERIGRIQLMHANNREDIKVHSQSDQLFLASCEAKELLAMAAHLCSMQS